MHGVGALDPLPPAARRLDRLVPARRHQARGQIGERSEHEQPLPDEPMRDNQVCRFGGIRRARVGRSIDIDSMAAENEQVEVELARAPALAIPAPERSLELLERHE